jgi:chromosome segregation ATPase
MDEQLSYRINEIFNIVTALRKQGEDHTVRLTRIEDGLKFVSGQQSDVIPKVIDIQKAVNQHSESQINQATKIVEMWNRLDAIEKAIRPLDERGLRIEKQVSNILAVISSMVENLGTGLDLTHRIDDIDQRIARIEEKLAA